MKINTVKKKKQNIFVSDFMKNKELYLMGLPIVIYYIMFHYVPIYGAIIAFKNYTPLGGIMNSEWVGFKHFMQFFNSPYFGTIMTNTLRISITALITTFPAPIILALLLNEVKSNGYKRVVQSVTYMPHFVSLVVICGMIKTFTMDTGIINTILSFFGFERTSLLLHPQYFVPIYVISEIWTLIGWNSIVYLAALSGIDQQLYEAAKIDGAGKWRQTLSVTIPGILPTIVTMLIMRVGHILSLGYEKILLLSNDYTTSVAEVISTYVYKQGIINQSWSFSAAVGIFNAVINLILLLAVNKISKRVADTALW